jgi:AcrR family transcriptional regulator
VPTLTHYFGRRDDIVATVLAAQEIAGRPYRAIAEQPTGDLLTSVTAVLQMIANGHGVGVGAIHAAGLAEGLGHPRLGPAYLQTILDPVIDAAATRLAAHVAAGQMRDVPPRTAALALVAPLLLVLLHQSELGGQADNPIDIDRFIATHAAAFARGYGTAALP